MLKIIIVLKNQSFSELYVIYLFNTNITEKPGSELIILYNIQLFNIYTIKISYLFLIIITDISIKIILLLIVFFLLLNWVLLIRLFNSFFCCLDW